MLKKYLAQFESEDGVEPQGLLTNNTLSDLYDNSMKNDELMLCATYLPPKYTSIIIQDQFHKVASTAMLSIVPSKFKKNVRKRTKKISEVRKFSKANSVFRDYKETGQDFARKQWEYDWRLSKINKFIRDADDLKNTYDVLLKYYMPLRDQFFH